MYSIRTTPCALAASKQERTGRCGGTYDMMTRNILVQRSGICSMLLAVYHVSYQFATKRRDEPQREKAKVQADYPRAASTRNPGLT